MSIQILFSYDKKEKHLTFNKSLQDIKLKEVRERLVSEKFFVDDQGQDKQANYRFVFPAIELIKDQEDLYYSDRVVGISVEEYISIDKMFIKNQPNVVFANIKTEDNERPTLIGFRASFWGDDKLQVTCRLRPTYNNSDVPEPYMLTDVITAREKDFTKIHIPNALICVQNSIIEFPIACKCTVGMAYSAWVDGQRIFDYASPLPPYVSNAVTYGCFDAFNNGVHSDEQQGAKVIKIEKLSSTDIGSKKLVSYDITITAEDVIQWTDYENGKKTTYTADSKRPSSNSKRMGGSTSADRVEQMVIDGNSYFKGKLVPGQSIPKRMPGVHTFTVDRKGDTIASIRIKVLVFKDMETARKFVGRYSPF